MTRMVVRWAVDGEAEGDADFVVRTAGSAKNFHVGLEDLEGSSTGLHALAEDLIRIAACAFAADQEGRRGAERDVYGEDWKREFVLRVPVSSESHWSQPAVTAALVDALHYVSGDAWEFEFRPLVAAGRGGRPGRLGLAEQADSVLLLSGGVDSLSAAISELTGGRVPLLLSHRSGSPQNAQQNVLRNGLRERFPGVSITHLGLPVHRVGRDARENSQRTRSFLYAAAGAAVANAHGIRRVILADNGVVTLNLPINKQLVGTLASRSTHPKFLALLNRLLRVVLTDAPEVVNPLWNSTKTEVVRTIADAGLQDLFQETRSCAHPWFRTVMQPHCGGCSQCVDRRFSALAAGIETFEDGSRYEIDVFKGALPQGEPKTTTVGYVDFARKVRGLGREELFLEFPELFDALPEPDPDYGLTATAYAEVFARHGETVIETLSQAYAHYSAELAEDRLPADSLLRISSSGDLTSLPSAASDAPTFELRGSAWRIWFDGEMGVLANGKGARDLAFLLQNCGKDVAATALYREAESGAGLAASDGLEVAPERGLGVEPDAAALQDYRARIRELQEEMDAAQETGDEEREETVRAEMEAIEVELKQSPSRRRRTRPKGEERARKAVAARLTAALEDLAAGHPGLALHLQTHLTFGAVLRYPCPPGEGWRVLS